MLLQCWNKTSPSPSRTPDPRPTPHPSSNPVLLCPRSARSLGLSPAQPIILMDRDSWASWLKIKASARPERQRSIQWEGSYSIHCCRSHMAFPKQHTHRKMGERRSLPKRYTASMHAHYTQKLAELQRYRMFECDLIVHLCLLVLGYWNNKQHLQRVHRGTHTSPQLHLPPSILAAAIHLHNDAIISFKANFTQKYFLHYCHLACAGPVQQSRGGQHCQIFLIILRGSDVKLQLTQNAEAVVCSLQGCNVTHSAGELKSASFEVSTEMKGKNGFCNNTIILE